MTKNTFSVNTNFEKGKFSGSVTGNYSLEDVQNSPYVADVPHNANTQPMWWTNSVPITTLQGDPDKPGADPETGMELLPTNDVWGGNPYWAAYQSVSDRSKDRMIGSARVRYDPTDWLYIQGRMGLDKYNREATVVTPTGPGYSPKGDFNLNERQFTQTNNELIVGFNKALDIGLGISGMVGGNMMEQTMNIESLTGSQFAIPFFHSLQNTVNPSRSVSTTQSGINSAYYSGELSYKSIYLTTTGRQDWFSTLDGKSIFYPSVSLSAVVSDLLDIPAFDFLKVRTAWSRVGGATSSPYSTSFNYSLGTPINGFASGRIGPSSVPNTSLVPLVSTEYEFGTDMRFFGNRLGIDFTIYSRKATDDILSVLLTDATGYTSTNMNIGEVDNKGIELLITGTIIKRNNFEWTTTFNIANNKSTVVNLLDPEVDNESLQVSNSRTFVHYIYQVEGLAYGQLTVYDYLKDAAGNKILDSNGLPQKAATMTNLGPGTAPTIGGWSNNFRYKNFIADFLIDYQFGG